MDDPNAGADRGPSSNEDAGAQPGHEQCCGPGLSSTYHRPPRRNANLMPLSEIDRTVDIVVDSMSSVRPVLLTA